MRADRRLLRRGPRRAARARWPTRRTASARLPRARAISTSRRSSTAAREHGAEAIHPGYGFLSENAEFAAACDAAGVVFIGPPAEAIRAMGSKTAAKRAVEAARRADRAGLRRRGERRCASSSARPSAIGFPVMIKAAAGGGGKGMRACDGPERVRGGAGGGAARGAGGLRRRRGLLREADRPTAPHRDPGVRRPLRQLDSPGRARVLDPAPPPEGDRGSRHRRARRRKCARRWARPPCARRGRSATSTRARSSSCWIAPARYYFLEMNTRLQVEHPVTEAVTGVDLVRLQLAIAAGERLALRAGRHRAARARHRGATLRRGPGERLPAVDRDACCVFAPPRGQACAWMPAWRRATT